MATQAGKAYVTVDYDPGSIRRLGSTTRTAAKGYESSWLGSAKRVALGLGGAFLGFQAVKGLLVEPIKAAGDFQESMNVLKATVGATAGQMKRASSEAIRLGADTKLPATSATDAATAMTELGKAGFTASQAMAAARGTLLLTTAAQTDEATAAKIAANAINVFGLAAGKAGHVANLLAGAANASSADVTDLAEALQFAGTGAAHAHQSIEDTLTAIAEMATAGQSGSTAGSALAQMFRSLQSPTAGAQEVLDKFNLSVFDSKGAMLPLPALVSEFSDKLGGLSDKQQSAALNTIFGSRAIRAAQIVLVGGRKEFDKYGDGVTRANAAQVLAEAHTKGFTGAIQSLQSAFETLQLEIGLKVLPALTPVVEALGKIIGAPNLHVAVRVAFEGIEEGAASLGGAIHDTLLGSTKTTTIKAPSGLVLGRSQVQTKGLVDSVQSAIVGTDWSKVGHTLGAAIGASLTFGVDTFSNIVVGLTAAVNDNKGAIARAGLGIGIAMVAALLDPGFWLENWKPVAAIAISAFLLALGPETTAARFATELPLIGPLFKVLQGAGGLALKAMRPFGRGLLRGLEQVFPDAAAAADRLVGRIIGRLHGLPGRAEGVLEDMGSAVGRRLGATANEAGGIARRIGSRILAPIRAIVGPIGSAALRLADRIVAPLRALAGRVVGPVLRAGGRIIDAIGGFIGQAFSAAAKIGRAITDGVISGIGSLVSRVSGAISSGIHKAIDIAKNTVGSTAEEYAHRELGAPIAYGVAGGVTANQDHMTRAIRSSVRGAIDGARGGHGSSGHGRPIVLHVDLGDGVRQVVTTHVDLAASELERRFRR